MCARPRTCVSKVVPSIAEHPLPLLLEAGIPCSLNGDDPLFFGASLLEEYELSRDKLGLSDEQLAGVARASIEASGAPGSLSFRRRQHRRLALPAAGRAEMYLPGGSKPPQLNRKAGQLTT